MGAFEIYERLFEFCFKIRTILPKIADRLYLLFEFVAFFQPKKNFLTSNSFLLKEKTGEKTQVPWIFHRMQRKLYFMTTFFISPLYNTILPDYIADTLSFRFEFLAFFGHKKPAYIVQKVTIGSDIL